MSEIRNVTVDQGGVFVEIYEHRDDAGELVDVTGYEARLQIREDVEDDEAVLELTDGAGITVGTNDGLFTVRATATQTAALEIETGVYDLEILPAGEEADAIRLAEGIVFVSRNVTRPPVP